MTYVPPRRLSVSTLSPHYDEEAINRIAHVYVDDVLIENCVAYDQDAGWAFGKGQFSKSWLPRQYGVVTITIKERLK